MAFSEGGSRCTRKLNSEKAIWSRGNIAKNTLVGNILPHGIQVDVESLQTILPIDPSIKGVNGVIRPTGIEKNRCNS